MSKFVLKPIALGGKPYRAEDVFPAPVESTQEAAGKADKADKADKTVASDSKQHVHFSDEVNTASPDTKSPDAVVELVSTDNQITDLTMSTPTPHVALTLDELRAQKRAQQQLVPQQLVPVAIEGEDAGPIRLGSKVSYELRVPRKDMMVAFRVFLVVLERYQKAGAFHFSESAELWRAIQVLNEGIAQLPDIEVSLSGDTK